MPSVRNVNKSIFFTFCVWFLLGCASTLIRDSYYYDFYEKVRPLMTEEELEAYRHLPDAAEKERFMTEFWAVRDPDPLTVDNEFKQEFEARLAYAEEHFGSRTGSQTVDTLRGWSTERGRIYLVLGPPDQRRAFWRETTPEVQAARDERDNSKSERAWSSEEEWYYAAHNMTLIFKNTRGRWRLEPDYPGLPSLLESVKLSLIARERELRARGRFRFELDFDGRVLRISIPTDRVNYAQRIGVVRARIEVSVAVFCDGMRIDTLSEVKEIRLPEAEWKELDALVIAMAYDPLKSGDYVFDVTATDVLAESPSPFRKTLLWSNWGTLPKVPPCSSLKSLLRIHERGE